MFRRFRAAIIVAALAALVASPPASAAPAYAPITGSGSSWAGNAVSNWSANLRARGLQVNYAASGSARGRADFAQHQVDFAVSDLTWQQAGELQFRPPIDSFAYVPLVAGAVGFTYNVTVGGVRETDVRLSGRTLAGIFSGRILNWNDPAITADNGRRIAPSLKIIPVIRSDAAAPSYHLTDWLSTEYPDAWTSFSDGGAMPYFPNAGGRTQAKAGSDGVMNYVRQSYANGAIGYVETAYARNAGFPLAAVDNASGHFIPPDPGNVSLSLLAARPDATGQLDLHPVFADPDDRAYPLSYTSYAIVPTKPTQATTPGKVQATVDFLGYALCNGQSNLPDLGYAQLPVNLTKTALNAGAKLVKANRAVDTSALAVAGCRNPTITHRPDGTSTDNLRRTVPMPPACSAEGAGPCRSEP